MYGFLTLIISQLAIGGSIVLIGIAIALIIVFAGGDESASESRLPGVKFEDYLSGKYRPAIFNGSWWSHDQILWEDSEGALVLWNITAPPDETIPLVDKMPPGAKFKAFCPIDDNLVLLAAGEEGVWRHSTEARYFVLDSDADKRYHIFPEGGNAADKLRYANWVKRENDIWLIFVHDNNIFLRKDFMAENPAADIKLSDDGEVDQVYNGIPDWVYEEEVLATNVAMYFSPSGKSMAYAHFNDTDVGDFIYQKFGNPSNIFASRYPTEYDLKYPKAGTTNPTVQLRVVDTEIATDASFLIVEPPDSILEGEYIYSAASWISETILSVIWMNRVQNVSSISECSLNNDNVYKCQTVSDMSQEDGWLDLFQPPKYSEDGMRFLQIRPVNISATSTTYHYFHIVEVTTATNDVKELTSGNGDTSVTEILGWDETDGVIYYMGTGRDGDPRERQFYAVHDLAEGPKIECLTCDLIMPNSQEPCLYSSVSLSEDFAHYVHTCRGPTVPEVVLRALNGDEKHVWEDNAQIRESVKNISTPTVQFLQVPVDGGFHAQVKMTLPPNHSADKKYALLVYVYAGPNTQNVDYRWSVGDWGEFLATNYDIVYASIDGRGSGYQSVEKLHAVYRQLGTPEIDDQIAVTKALLDQYSYLDADRTGIWGWSYGGYATLMSLAKDAQGVFSCGISVAPVTSWLLYDTVYTERYMAMPTREDNMEGYRNSTPVAMVENFRDKSLLLDHGVADDNVHYQQSLLFAEAMQKEDVPFEMMSYTDENHSIGGTSKFLYHSHDAFWAKCFGLQSKIESP